MGGTLGHLNHLHEDVTLRFSDLIEIVKSLDCVQVYEKFDGMQLSFNRDKFARSLNEIDTGGTPAEQFLSAYEKMPKVHVAFTKAVEAILAKNRQTRWFHIEVIDPCNKNVIAYDEPALVFHSDVVEDKNSYPSWRVLDKKDCSITNLRVPDVIKNDVIWMLSQFAQTHSTINQFLQSQLVQRFCSTTFLPKHVAAIIAERIATKQSFLRDLKPILSNEQYAQAQDINKSITQLLHASIEPIERELSILGQAIIDNLTSVLISDGDKESVRINTQLQAIQSMLTPQQLSKVEHHVRKLAWFPESSRTAIEGIVLQAGKFKMTGKFSMINQIGGCIRY